MTLQHALNGLMVTFALCTSLVAWAGDSHAPLQTPTTLSTAPLACPSPGKLLAEGTTDCCAGHKGVCGCRAGKIVCCDNTKSAGCTCHGDSGVETN